MSRDSDIQLPEIEVKKEKEETSEEKLLEKKTEEEKTVKKDKEEKEFEEQKDDEKKTEREGVEQKAGLKGEDQPSTCRRVVSELIEVPKGKPAVACGMPAPKRDIPLKIGVGKTEDSTEYIYYGKDSILSEYSLTEGGAGKKSRRSDTQSPD